VGVQNDCSPTSAARGINFPWREPVPTGGGRARCLSRDLRAPSPEHDQGSSSEAAIRPRRPGGHDDFKRGAAEGVPGLLTQRHPARRRAGQRWRRLNLANKGRRKHDDPSPTPRHRASSGEGGRPPRGVTYRSRAREEKRRGARGPMVILGRTGARESVPPPSCSCFPGHSGPGRPPAGRSGIYVLRRDVPGRGCETLMDHRRAGCLVGTPRGKGLVGKNPPGTGTSPGGG